MKTKKLVDLAKTIRSKNAGTDKITFDIIFREKKNYDLVKKSGALTKATIAKLYGIPAETHQRLSSNSIPPMRSNSRSIANSTAEVPAMATSSAASSTRPCWMLKCPWNDA